MSPRLSNHCKPKRTYHKPTPYKPLQAGIVQEDILEAEQLPKLVELPRLVELPKRRKISMQSTAKDTCCIGPFQATELDFVSQAHDPETVFQPFPNCPQLPEHRLWPHKNAISYNHSTGTGMSPSSDQSDYAMLPLYQLNPISNIQLPSSSYQPNRTMVPRTHHSKNCFSHKTISNSYCGNPCSCLGCAAKSNHDMVTEYAWLMHHNMSISAFTPRYDLDTNSHQINDRAGSKDQLAFNTNVPTSFMQRAPEHLLYAMSMKNMRDTANSGFKILAPRQQDALESPAQTLLLPNAQYLSASIQHQKQSTFTSMVRETAGETAARTLAAETSDDA
ncbi:hypothetical protein K505DRAFT_18576 [Melanomma pulvis-pyrius CBS 109.77]|uniref:Copper-fist domain-containing protein n=1 Tax=Melanomma pulvis-pyrius CBS 109.77 TaxID=1314802 RepID=A0A6A6XGA4_9PLEO|nr:hypothetical protein K505DRAFT_18576 [Melanomma pulvis-pyrius CBS 109.77]